MNLQQKLKEVESSPYTCMLHGDKRYVDKWQALISRHKFLNQEQYTLFKLYEKCTSRYASKNVDIGTKVVTRQYRKDFEQLDNEMQKALELCTH